MEAHQRCESRCQLDMLEQMGESQHLTKVCVYMTFVNLEGMAMYSSQYKRKQSILVWMIYSNLNGFLLHV